MEEIILHYFWLIFGSLLILDSLFASRISNLNLGVLLPALLGVPMACYGILLWQTPEILASSLMRCVVTVCAVGYAGIALMLLFCICITVTYALSCKHIQADVIIVLGAGLRGERPSRILRMRLNAAIQAAKQSRKVPILVTGGKGRNELIPEAEAMQRYLLQQGIEPGRIIKEEKACNTYENLKFSRALLQKDKKVEGKILIVTSDFHCFRAAQIAKKFFSDFSLRPVPSAWYMWPNFYLRETLSIANYYRLELFQK